MTMKWILLGAVLGGVGVGLGAFGAHGLDRYFVEKYASTPPKTIAGYSVPASWKYLQDYKTGVRYHLYHALALLAVGLLSLHRPSRWLNAAGVLFLLGILLFSGSLYVLTIAGPDWLGVIWGLVAAVGGTMFILGWVAFAVGACPCRR
jgi:uncharacterized membrane protein YgdD (TMEM256/DUF423 family)